MDGSKIEERLLKVRDVVISVREKKLPKEESIAELKKAFDKIGFHLSNEELELIYSYGK